MGILPLKIIVPITAWDVKYEKIPWHVKLIPDLVNGLSKVSSADTFQVRSISDARFINKIGSLQISKLEEIKRGLLVSLDIS